MVDFCEHADSIKGEQFFDWLSMLLASQRTVLYRISYFLSQRIQCTISTLWVQNAVLLNVAVGGQF